MTRSQSSSVSLNSRLSRVTPALFTRMWTPPSSRDHPLDRRADTGRVADVAADADRLAPSASGSLPAASPAADSSRSRTATEAPSSANRVPMPNPIPRAAPVTMATRPSKRPMGDSLFFRRQSGPGPGPPVTLERPATGRRTGLARRDRGTWCAARRSRAGRRPWFGVRRAGAGAGTDWLTVLFIATNEPWAPSPATAADDSRWAASRKPSRSGAGRSGSVTTCSRGTSSTCPLKTGRASRNAAKSGSSRTRSASMSPARIEQKTQSSAAISSAPPRSVADSAALEERRVQAGARAGAAGAGVEVLGVAVAVGPAQAVAGHDPHHGVRPRPPRHALVGVPHPPRVRDRSPAPSGRGSPRC